MSNAALKELLGASSTIASRWPDDAEFTNAILTAPIYPGNLDSARCRMLLTELEGFLRPSHRSEEPQIPDLSNLDIDRKSGVTEKRVSVRVDLGGRRIIKKKNKTIQ